MLAKAAASARRGRGGARRRGPLADARRRSGEVRRGDGVCRRGRRRSTRRCRSRASTSSRKRSCAGGYDTVLFSQLGAGGRRRRRPRRPARRRAQLGPRRRRARGTARSSASGRRCRTRCSSTSAGARPRGSRCSAPGSFDAGRDRRRRAEDRSRRRSSSQAHSRRREGRRARSLDETRGPSIEDAEVVVAGGMRPRRARRTSLWPRSSPPRSTARSARPGPPSTPGWYPHVGADRPDRQDGHAEAVRGPRHLWRRAAQGRHAELEGDRRDQQGPERADLRVQRPGGGRRRPRDRSEADRAAGRAQGLADGRGLPTTRRRFERPTSSASPPTPPTTGSRSVCWWWAAGPAGLACAIRFGQLLEEDPDTAEQLGEVPLAVLEKGKQPGSHLLSGAVRQSARRSAGSSATGFGSRTCPTTGRCRVSRSTC